MFQMMLKKCQATLPKEKFQAPKGMLVARNIPSHEKIHRRGIRDLVIRYNVLTLTSMLR